MRKHDTTPSSHVWREVAPGLWRCAFCTGYFLSPKKPDKEAIAISYQEAIQNEAQET